MMFDYSLLMESGQVSRIRHRRGFWSRWFEWLAEIGA